ncbi:MAG: hypothetical protein WBO23_13655 [Burkholderiales bacterium]
MSGNITDEELADGCWWRNPWWEDENWVSQSKYTLPQIRAAVEELKAVFSSEWATKIGKNDVANIFLRNVRYGQSIWQHRYIVELGQRIATLRDRPGFASVLSRLLSVDGSESANMELSLAALLLRSSFDIEFPVPNPNRGKSPDIIACCRDEVVAFECKQLEVSNKQQWLDSYYHYASQLLRDHLDNKERQVQFEFDEPPVDRYFQRDGKPICEATAVADELIGCMISHVRGQFAASSSPCLFGIEGIGHGRFVGKTEPSSAWMRFPLMSEDRLFARLFSNGIARASEQLRAADFPGIAAIYAEYSPSFEYAQGEFGAIVSNEPSLYGHLTACLVFQRQALFQYHPPLLLVNPASRVKFDQLNVSNVIRKAYGLEEECAANT